MIEKEFIPYEQAMDLKELGFNELSLRFFYRSGSGNILAKINDGCESINPYSDVFRILGHNKIDQSVSGSFLISPTFSQSFRWFRGKSLFITIIPSSIDKKHLPIIYNFQKEGLHSYVELKVCDTYEEAELACLKKLIEIVKEKSNT